MFRVTYPADPFGANREIVEDNEGSLGYYYGHFSCRNNPKRQYIRTGTTIETSWLCPTDLTVAVCDKCQHPLIGEQIADRKSLGHMDFYQWCDRCVMIEISEHKLPCRDAFANAIIAVYKPGMANFIEPWTHQRKNEGAGSRLIAIGYKIHGHLFMINAQHTEVR